MKGADRIVLALLIMVSGVLTSSDLITAAWAQDCGRGDNPGQPPFLSAVHDLEEFGGDWGVFCEKSPTFRIRNVLMPALDGRSLECAITGGTAPFSNVHCFLDLAENSAATNFIVKYSFLYRPTTTHGDDQATVQALEFTMNKYKNELRYEWALQWRNVGISGNPAEGAPQWYYWDRFDWVLIPDLPIDHRLEANCWHTITIEGDIQDDRIHYRRFSVERVPSVSSRAPMCPPPLNEKGYFMAHELDLVTMPVVQEGEPDRLRVAVQLDGNFEVSPYEMFIDKVSLVSSSCIPDANTLCLNDARFRVTATFRTPDGVVESARVVQETSDSGYLWFFNPENIEVVVKVLNACTIFDHYWVFAGGLTNLEVEITVEDTQTGVRNVYTNPQGVPFEPVQDTNAFTTCP